MPSKKPNLPPIDSLDAAFQSAKQPQRTQEELDALPPGIYCGVPFHQYCRINAVNFSSLCRIDVSPKHYKETPQFEDTEALKFGSFVHEGKLEPHLIATQYVVCPTDQWDKLVHQHRKEENAARRKAGKKELGPVKSPRSTKVFKDLRAAFLKSHEGKIDVTREQYDGLQTILKHLAANDRCKKLFFDGHPEVTIIWIDPETGIKCKGRIDWLSITPQFDDAQSVDLKTTWDMPGWNMDHRNYHVQQTMYCEGYHHAAAACDYTTDSGHKVPSTLQPWIAVIESGPPYCVQAAPISQTAIDAGYRKFRKWIDALHACRTKRRYPGPKSPAVWNLKYS